MMKIPWTNMRIKLKTNAATSVAQARKLDPKTIVKPRPPADGNTTFNLVYHRKLEQYFEEKVTAWKYCVKELKKIKPTSPYLKRKKFDDLKKATTKIKEYEDLLDKQVNHVLWVEEALYNAQEYEAEMREHMSDFE